MSDIYAMNARPLFALNIVSFPTNRLSLRVLDRILSGATEVAREAGVSNQRLIRVQASGVT